MAEVVVRTSPFLGLLGLLVACGSASDGGYARARVIADLADGVGGPKALARAGDFVLENDRLKVAILSARNSMGPGKYGGSIVDADLQWDDARFPSGYGNDQFAELFSTVNMNVTASTLPDQVRIISDGSDGGPAIVRAEGPGDPFITLLAPLWAIVDQPTFGVVTDYIVEAGQPWVKIRTTATVDWDGTTALSAEGEPVDYSSDTLPILNLAMTDGVALGDFYLSGGAIDVFAPGMGFDEDGEVFEANQRKANTFTEPFRFDFLAGVGDGISYGIAPAEGSGYVPLFTSSQTAMFGGGKAGDPELRTRFVSGTALTYERYFYIGHGDVGSVLDSYLEQRQIPRGTVEGHVLEASTAAPLAGVDVFVYQPGATRPYSQWRTDVDPRDTVDDGSFGGTLPAGDWELLVHHAGRPDSGRLPIHVDEGGTLRVQLESPRPGTVSFAVTDEVDHWLPSKISIFRDDGPTRRDPVLGDGRVGGSPEAVLFATYGSAEIVLPDGRYRAVASRGIEYELDEAEFTVEAGLTQHVDLKVTRAVETDGWISADFHVHSFPSHDSGVTLPDRVGSMVCEGVEFFSSTDHDYLTDFAPVVEDMDLEEWVQTAVGNETTTIEIGHFLGFPLAIDHLADAQGAFDWTDHPPQEILDALKAEGAAAGYSPATFVGHPRDGILGYFDQYGFSPYEGTPGVDGPGQPVVHRPTLARANPLLATELMSWDFDGLEMLNGKRMELIRTPTQRELDAYKKDRTSVDIYHMIERTMDEQEGLAGGEFRLGYGQEGQIDDWFTLLNLGYRYTVLANSDTHDHTGVESGCPRNLVMSDTDDPAFVDDQAVADAIKKHQVIATYGPVLQMWVNDAPIGSDVDGSGGAHVVIDIQAPSWIGVDRVELYENGTLIREWSVPDSGAPDRFHEELDLAPDKDSWYVVSCVSRKDLSPVFTTVEIPYIQLQDVVTDALTSVPAVQSFLPVAVPIPTAYPVYPYAITNPIWVDADGGGFTPPGLPSWLKPSVPPG